MVLHVIEGFLDLFQIIVLHEVTPQGGCAYFTQGNRVSVEAIRVFADAPVRSDVIEIAAVKIGVKIGVNQLQHAGTDESFRHHPQGLQLPAYQYGIHLLEK